MLIATANLLVKNYVSLVPSFFLISILHSLISFLQPDLKIDEVDKLVGRIAEEGIVDDVATAAAICAQSMVEKASVKKEKTGFILFELMNLFALIF